MVTNPQRRIALIDAAIEVLARDGARGLTFRAVDAEAGVPKGTASNYFASRDDLLRQAAERIHLRVAVEDVDSTETDPETRLTQFMRLLLQRISDDRAGWLALVELRLEATRRPELAAILTKTLRDNLDAVVLGRREGDLPGDDLTAVLLYYAMTGLILEHLTLPDVLHDVDLDELVRRFVRRSLPHT
ncbi:TetR/AcrR family transcriptional regulator [Saccharomonospora viridis]|jgi:AcrR family transcriptional regulator|uniref:Transcriptional regulator, TetR family n=2 Tax=Saccharomonospora viridis TaxID=1852 RepID=C7MZN1_SACVD|nr:TetR/AcrR family transcriptional regulator [Saccharomonospora viridis]ACU98260.1 transcriptional regulator, TetR family [Saccharomonospora viridis DSM 43017]KHF44049.1 TetR family transcriptional regulator [Saccharomonospora viridis]SFP55285.1 transcriptional regulator, TetR family [Saccharomonospora viridis]